MHRINELDLTIKGISKIEGHTDLEIKIKKDKVKEVKLKISENKRFYTQAIRGKPFNNVSQIVSRICGTCSIAHQIACTLAIENACDFNASNNTMLLRKLLLNGLMIRDHAMHLYLFVLPDLFEKESIFELKDKWLKDAFSVKKAGNELCTLIGGRAIHPINMNLGFFNKIPEKNEIKSVINSLKTEREKVIALINLFNESSFSLNVNEEFVALVSKKLNFIEGELTSTANICIPKTTFFDYFERVIFPYSQATGFKLKGKPFIVGALARINLNKNALNNETTKEIKNALKNFPSQNIFLNNLAQAIEILHCIDESIELLESNEFKEEKVEVKPKEKKGIALIEAPRGTLYYLMELTKEGKIKEGNIVIPTQQNQVSMQLNIKKLVESLLEKGIKDKHLIQHEIEKLIRAFDPCMSCASHFLKIKWKH